MILKTKSIMPIILVILVVLLCACKKEDEKIEEDFAENKTKLILEQSTELESAEQLIKGYDLPVEEKERKEAVNDGKVLMDLVFDIYEQAYKGDSLNVVLNHETIIKMLKEVKKVGYPVTTQVPYSNMENYEDMDRFLQGCEEGTSGFIVSYKIFDSGNIGRNKFIFNGKAMYLLATNYTWDIKDTPQMNISFNRIKEWEYTDKGWFCFKLCVPEPPEVSEIMNGSCMIRIKPMTEVQREMSEKCVQGLGYQGSNLLCSNWDLDHMEELDYNGIYESLYGMKYQKKLTYTDYPNGIPKDEFEALIMEYLLVTVDQIREYAVFDEVNQTYVWEVLGCSNYVPTFFGTSIPEVVDIRENEDGTVTLTVEAVCDMVICDDAVITHELTVKFAQDGSFQYLENRILNDGIRDIPDYQYRINKS